MLWTLLGSPYSNWSESFATRDALSSSPVKVLETSLAGLHGGDLRDDHCESAGNRYRRPHCTNFQSGLCFGRRTKDFYIVWLAASDPSGGLRRVEDDLDPAGCFYNRQRRC